MYKKHIIMALYVNILNPAVSYYKKLRTSSRLLSMGFRDQENSLPVQCKWTFAGNC